MGLSELTERGSGALSGEQKERREPRQEARASYLGGIEARSSYNRDSRGGSYFLVRGEIL